MNELTKQMQQIMHPRAVLVAYECETTGYSTPRSYLELRPVNEKGRMGAGIPVTYEFMNSLVESYTESMSGIPHGRIPGNMLLCDSRKGRERYIWYNPPQKRKMYFQDGLHITDGTLSSTWWNGNECHHRRSELFHNRREGLRTELLTGGSTGKTGPVHQLHTGTSRL